jgi:tripartite-type tricarboxylate transporter receptor subunit TctC
MGKQCNAFAGRLACAAALLAGMSTTAFAQDFPAKPVKIVLAFAPGGPADASARLVADHLTKSLGQPVVVENRPGATGMIAAQAVAKSPADGYTLLYTSTSGYSTAPLLMEKLPLNPFKELDPVSMVLEYPLILISNPALNVNNLQGLVALAKAKPGSFSYGSPGQGSIGNIVGEQFRRLAGFEAVHVPYKGSALVVTDVVAGRLAFAIESIYAANAFIPNGRVKVLAVSRNERTALLPEVPTFAEAGYPPINQKMWFGLFAPAGTPVGPVNKVQAEVARMARLPEIRKILEGQATEPAGNTPREFRAVIDAEVLAWGKVIKETGIKLE